MQRRKLWLGTTILRNRVRTSAGEDIGKIEDVIVDAADQRLIYAVVMVDGYPELFVVPWSLFSASPWPDYVLLNIDKRTLERGPSFNPADWPDITDAAWERRIQDHYRTGPVAVGDRTVRVERPVARPVVVPRRTGVSVFGGIVLALILAGLLWMAYLVSTRGWEGTKEQLANTFSGAAYAMKETSLDATLTAKVKTALSLNKNVPAAQINVDSEGDVVTLRGEVANDEVRSIAEKVAADTPGVGAVHNHLYTTQHTQ
jgi:BON domain-containing protein/PRC-barrel domain protein